jgi:HK97 family phage major capsid protein
MEMQALVEKIGSLKTQTDEIVVRNKGNEHWPPEDQSKYDDIWADLSKYREQKRRLEQIADLDRELSKSERQTEPNEIRRRSDPDPAPPRRQATDDECEYALRAWMLSQHGASAASAIKPEWRTAAQKLGVDLRSTEFPFQMAPTQPMSLRSDDMERWEKRALTLTTTAGGYLVSPAMNRALEETRLYFGPMLSLAYTLRTTDSGAVLQIPTFNGTATKGRILGVNTQITLTDPAFGTVPLGAFKYSSDGVLVPVELIQDSGIPIGDFLGRILGERIGRILNEHFTIGTGTTLPTGVVVGAGAVNLGTGTAAGFGSFTTGVAVANLLKIMHGVDLAYRNGNNEKVGWMMNDATLQVLAGAVDTTGRPLWMPSLVAGEPDRFMGYRIFINNDMTATFANNARTVLFGDFSKYWIRETRDIVVESSRERFIDFHQVVFLAFGRFDGVLINSAAVKAGVHQT